MESQHQNPNNEALVKQLLAVAGPLPESTASISEQRGAIEGAVGDGIDYAFNQHADAVVTDDEGKRHLSLTVQHERGPATVEVVESVAEDGSRTVDLSFSGKKVYGNHWRFTEDQDGCRLTPFSKDPATGQLSPRAASPHYDPNSDSEVVWWGKPWVRNFYEGTPKRQTSGRFRRFLGRGAISR